MPPTDCHRCDLLQSETWRLAQRLADLDRRLAHLALAVDRLAHVVQTIRRELRDPARRAS
jgi:ABC-type transporter Mla subunit MlaD